jgi:hypothetical protein
LEGRSEGSIERRQVERVVAPVSLIESENREQRWSDPFDLVRSLDRRSIRHLSLIIIFSIRLFVELSAAPIERKSLLIARIFLFDRL